MFGGALTACLGGVALAQDNLVGNPSFEERDAKGQPGAWSFWGKAQAFEVTDRAFVGQAALRIAPPPGATYRLQQDLALQQAGTHDLTFHTQVVGQTQVHATWSFTDHAGQRVATPRYWTRRISASQAGSGWLPVRTPLEVPPGATQMTLTFWVALDKSASPGHVLLDAVSLTARHAPPGHDALPLPGQAKQVYASSFDDSAALADWTTLAGEARVEGQALVAGPRAVLLLKRDVTSPNMRLEYTVRAQGQPADLSAMLAVDAPAPWARLRGYFFGFGSQLNTTHVIQRLPASGGGVLARQGGALQTLANPVVPGRAHRVVVQRQHHELRMAVDGQLVLEGHDTLYAAEQGSHVGLYLWEGGVIDDVKVYALPWSASAAQTQRAIEHQRVHTWEDPADQPLALIQGSADLKRVNLPTWVYAQPSGNALRDDHALHVRVSEGPSHPTQLRIDLPAMDSGLVELDFMRLRPGRLRMALCDTQGREVLHVVITPDGQFTAETLGRLVPLRDTVRHQRRAFDAPVRLIPETWCTLRFQFMEGSAQIALLDQYAEIRGDFDLGKLGDHLPLLDDHTFAMQGRQVASLVITPQDDSELYLDNVIAFGPLGTQAVRGKPLHQSAATLLDLDLPPRKDPFLLKVQSYRHLTRENYRITPRQRLGKAAPHDAPFRQAGQAYNASLVALAFIEERLALLRRSAHYAIGQPVHATLLADLSRLDAMYARRERLQQDALRAYAEAYLDGQQPQLLETFHGLVTRLGDEDAALHAALDASLARLDELADTQASPRPVGQPVDDTPARWQPQRKRWEKAGQPVMITYFSHAAGNPLYHDDLALLGMDRPADVGSGYHAFPFRDGQESALRHGAYVDEAMPNWRWLDGLQAQRRQGLMRLGLGFNFAVTAAPDWWVKDHQGQDIFMTDRQGRLPSPTLWRGQQMLDWWQPAVGALIERQFEAVSALAAPRASAISLVHAGWELKNTFPRGVTPGYSPGAIAAFRQSLASEHGSLATLNQRWGTRYASWEDITPLGMDLTQPSGLRLAHSRFVHEGFNGWLAAVTRAMHRHLPEVPVASDSQYTLGGRVTTEAIDPVGYFRAVDVKLYHTYQAWDRLIVDRWHGQLGQALGTAWGTMEWATSQGTGEMFRTEVMRHVALREKAMQMIWGAALSEFYGFGFDNWQYATGIHEPRLDRLVFNYTAPLYPLSMDRARRFGQAALVAPLAKPQVGLLETTTSYHQGLPVRDAMREAATQLADHGWDYLFLYETLLRDGTQSLDGIEVLIVPHGLCMDDALHARLRQWVEQGGVLLAVGTPPGWLDETGRPATGRASLANGAWRASPQGWTLPTPPDVTLAPGARAWSADLGLGRVIVLPTLTPPPEASPQAAAAPLLPAWLSGQVRQRVVVSDARVQWCLRQQGDVLHLYVVNTSVDRHVKADITVRHPIDTVTDEGLEKPLRVPVDRQSQGVRFQTTLAPAMVTLFTMRGRDLERHP